MQKKLPTDQSEQEASVQKTTSFESQEQFNVKNFIDGEEGNKSTYDESAGTMNDNNDL